MKTERGKSYKGSMERTTCCGNEEDMHRYHILLVGSYRSNGRLSTPNQGAGAVCRGMWTVSETDINGRKEKRQQDNKNWKNGTDRKQLDSGCFIFLLVHRVAFQIIHLAA
ncbi:hypothetical protein AMECASPLE_007854 [Ameca splendens]|uniref:Uncharacterized protein n=1 Tax=Ameca splendens TaxID=208324 RepID=A0ABV0YAY0_9TELE